jgi:CDP-diacylglycerol--glycerol-3-phosphate 3-phosphatidyltransferase
MSGTPVTAAGAPGSEGQARMKDRLRQFAHAIFGPPARWLYALGIRPDHVTWLGFGLSVAAGLAFFEGLFRVGALVALLSGLCDILDGQLARVRGTTSRFGAFLDSTLDRFADAFLLIGIAGFYIANLVQLTTDPLRVMEELERGLEPRTWALVALLAVLALVGSLMVSYTRARAEGLGLDCKVGWFERPERMVLLIVAGLFGIGPVMPWALLILTVMAFVTVAQRMSHVHKNTRGAGLDP